MVLLRRRIVVTRLWEALLSRADRSAPPTKERHMSVRAIRQVAALCVAALVAAACGGDGAGEAETVADSGTGEGEAEIVADPGEGEPLQQSDGGRERPEPGPLGAVEIEAGVAIQIRSLEAITGDVAFLGIPNMRSTELAIEDYGPIRGFDVELGTPLDDLCSSDGGQASAQIIVADEDVLGVIGTSCSGAAVAAAPLITQAGMTMISASNTSPALTSDLQGNAGENHSVGYYRTSHNDLFQAAAVAQFVLGELGLVSAAVIHDGDPYTQGLAHAFAAAFEATGGVVTGVSAINKEDTDMVPVLTELAAGAPEALFFPIFQPAGDFVADQAPRVPGLEGAALLASGGLLNVNFLGLPQTAGMYLAGPDTRFGNNVNESTGRTVEEFLDLYEERFGEPPAAPYWAHAYDATVLLLDAIRAASYVSDDGDGDTLVVDRQGIRDYLNSVEEHEGLTGTLSCDRFGDCGAGRIAVVHNVGGEENAEASMSNVVFSYAPPGE